MSKGGLIPKFKGGTTVRADLNQGCDEVRVLMDINKSKESDLWKQL